MPDRNKFCLNATGVSACDILYQRCFENAIVVRKTSGETVTGLQDLCDRAGARTD